MKKLLLLLTVLLLVGCEERNPFVRGNKEFPLIEDEHFTNQLSGYWVIDNEQALILNKKNIKKIHFSPTVFIKDEKGIEYYRNTGCVWFYSSQNENIGCSSDYIYNDTHILFSALSGFDVVEKIMPFGGKSQYNIRRERFHGGMIRTLHIGEYEFHETLQ